MKILFSPFSPYVRKCLVTAHELGLDGQIQLLPSNAHPVQRAAPEAGIRRPPACTSRYSQITRLS